MALRAGIKTFASPPMGVQYPQSIENLFSVQPQTFGQAETVWTHKLHLDILGGVRGKFISFFIGTIEEFLARFPEGEYEFEGRTVDGGELESAATLTHVLPALPEIISPVSDGEDPPMVDPTISSLSGNQ